MHHRQHVRREQLTCLFQNRLGQKIGSCCAILEHPKIPAEFRPEIPLQSDSVKDTDWEDAEMEIALVAIPTLAPIPYGKEIKSTTLDENIIEE